MRSPDLADISPEEAGIDLLAEGSPEINCFFISGGRHDKDRIEVQFGFDGLVRSEDQRFKYDVDLVLFVPKTLGLLEVDDNDQLRQEFQSYVRLHTHVSNPNSETSLLRVRERIQKLRDEFTPEHVRVLAIEFEALLKGQSKRIRKEIKRASKETHLVSFIVSEVEMTRVLISDFREILSARGLSGKGPEELPLGIDHDILLLDEYLSHLFVQYLSVLQHSEHHCEETKPIQEALNIAGDAEFEVRQSRHFLLDQRHGPQSSEDVDLYLRRISVLKKFFQKPIFVEIAGKSLQTRLYIPVYGVVAAFAAAFAIIVQIYQAQTLTQKVGINSVALITIGVVAYVVKDIFKDFGRRFLYNKSRMVFADYEKKLYIRRENQRRVLGKMKEFLRTFDSERLPKTLHHARYSVRGGEMEAYLHEDVLHFRKKVELDLSLLDTKKEFPWGLREIVRIRCDRLLTSMEDAFKTMHLLSKGGITVTRQGHRVYHLYLASWIKREAVEASGSQGPQVRPSFKAFRITLDKTGVLACEPVKWRQEFGTPEIPA